MAMKVYTSFGVGKVVLEFMEEKDKLLAQLLNRYVYDIAISRVQTILTFPYPYIFILPNSRALCQYMGRTTRYICLGVDYEQEKD